MPCARAAPAPVALRKGRSGCASARGASSLCWPPGGGPGPTLGPALGPGSLPREAGPGMRCCEPLIRRRRPVRGPCRSCLPLSLCPRFSSSSSPCPSSPSPPSLRVSFYRVPLPPPLRVLLFPCLFAFAGLSAASLAFSLPRSVPSSRLPFCLSPWRRCPPAASLSVCLSPSSSSSYSSRPPPFRALSVPFPVLSLPPSVTSSILRALPIPFQLCRHLIFPPFLLP